ncbi:MAG: valine--tRNA ligase [archaeon]|nr:valine--tRNA ligase [archaeon]
MDKARELYISSKYKFLSKTGEKSEEDLKKEKLLLKELKKKQMQEKCNKKAAIPKIKKDIKYEDKTVPGEKKDLSGPMPEVYDPGYVESSWNAWWQKQNFFKVDVNEASSKPRDKRFVMILPPPNVTGSLHLGHTLMGTIEDAIIRYKKQKGYSALWVPGTDHAGIATQSVVEKKLLKEEKKYRTDFTREEFVKKVWEWKEKYGGRIMEQFTRLGVSFDLSRYFFTLDDKRSVGVQQAFIDLFERGILYRAKRMVNWCCALQTAISDVEIDDFEIDKPMMLSIPMHSGKYEFGVLIDFAYRFKNDPSKEIIVSTTRIETMLGDTAVAVDPTDERYKDVIGQELIHPFFPERKMKIIADGILVDKSFGTGAVKITPAHDPNDFACGKRNNLEFINIFNDDGTLNENGAEFKGMKRYDCRNAIIKRLDEMKLIKGKHPNKMVIQRCSKTGDIIEPMVKAQWWINCDDVAKRTIEEVNNGKIKIIPEFHKQTLFGFLNNIQQWCISRRLWWGHQCPAYLCKIKGVIDSPDESNNEHWVAARNEEEAIKKAAEKFKVDDVSKISVRQDEDVLDTWFSSALLPFSSLGWPNEESLDLKTFFPTDLLETGHDIIFFWVARMIFMSYFFKNEAPFHTVFLHPIVKDSQGRKMSKSLGNVIDPIEVIDGTSLDNLINALMKGNLPKAELERSINEKKKEFPEGIPQCGADALRLGLMSYLIQGRNINLDILRVISYRFFGNKIWNAIKFLFIYISKDFKLAEINPEKLTFIDKWILDKLGRTIKSFEKNFDEYNFGEATNKLYAFWYNNICDVYIESLKTILGNNSPYDEETKNNTKNVFLYCIENALILLHPLCPFISEELFQRLPFKRSKAESICNAEFPKVDERFINDEVESLGNNVLEISHGINSVLSQFQINKDRPKAAIYSKNEKLISLLNNEKTLISSLSKLPECFTVTDKNDKKVENWLINVINSEVDAFIDLKDKIDFNKEIGRLNKIKAEKEKAIENIKTKQAKKDYATRVPENVRKDDQERMEKFMIELKKTE